MSDTNLEVFIACHEPVLARDEPRHGLILNTFMRAHAGANRDLQHWTLGAPGQCAIKTGPHSIVLGDLDPDQCRGFAERITDYPGVMGPEDTATWFVERANELGLAFDEPELQLIYRLDEAPRHPGASGSARRLASEDKPLFACWVAAFCREAVPHDPVPSVEEIAEMAASGDFLLWVDADRPVSMARVTRRLSYSAAITAVYTPPEHRGHGYAGSVTAAVVERIRSEGRGTACLYTDTRNPASNRCYSKIGFKPVCKSMHFHRHEAA
jgi:ribosomal protein S18 acetylase RimI-like enzyme